jgi:4-amino-4-deoxy-L-arabinose transferase-like glycosyltransferase
MIRTLVSLVSKWSPQYILAVWISIFGIAMAFTLNNTFPIQGDESFYTVSAAHMVQSHSYMVPEYFGQPRFQKPPLTYWIVAGSYKLLGISLWSGRIPILILSCLTLLVVYRLSRLYIDKATFGLFTVILLSASYLFVSFSRIAMNEPVLAFFLTSALYAFTRADTGNTLKHRWLFAGWLCVAAACMAKGPAALLLPVAFTAYVIIIYRRACLHCLLKLYNPLYILLVVLIVAPWYMYNFHYHHDALLGTALGETAHVRTSFGLLRYMSHTGFYAYTLLLCLFPFSVIALVRWFRSRPVLPKKILLPFLFCIVTLMVFIFFVKEHKDRYMYTVLPAIAVITGAVLYSSRHRLHYAAGAAVVASLLLSLYVCYPVFPRESLRELVGIWQHTQKTSAPLGVYNLDAKRKGWVMLMAGGNASIDTYAAGYVITNEAGLQLIPDAVVIAKSSERTGLVYRHGKIRLVANTFILAQRSTP